MKKIATALASFLPLFTIAAQQTIPTINATQCDCSVSQGKDFFTCKKNDNPASIISLYLGTLSKDDHFAATGNIAPGQTQEAIITDDDGQPAVAYNSDGAADYYETADLSDFHDPAALTFMHFTGNDGSKSISFYYPTESRCLNTQTCQYSTTTSGCLHPEILTRVSAR